MAHRRWIWVEDTQTKHRFDVDHRQVDRLVQEGAVEVVEGYPINEGANVQPRTAKHATGLDGEPRRLDASADVPSGGELFVPKVAPTIGEPAATPSPAPSRRGATRSATAASTATTIEGAERS